MLSNFLIELRKFIKSYQNICSSNCVIDCEVCDKRKDCNDFYNAYELFLLLINIIEKRKDNNDI